LFSAFLQHLSPVSLFSAEPENPHFHPVNLSAERVVSINIDQQTIDNKNQIFPIF
jgi:hypothetical protein